MFANFIVSANMLRNHQQMFKRLGHNLWETMKKQIHSIYTTQHNHMFKSHREQKDLIENKTKMWEMVKRRQAIVLYLTVDLYNVIYHCKRHQNPICVCVVIVYIMLPVHCNIWSKYVKFQEQTALCIFPMKNRTSVHYYGLKQISKAA